jgi:hypothetical protein
MRQQDRLAGGREEHDVGFPMTGLSATLDAVGSRVDRGTVGIAGPAALGPPAALVFGAREVEAPAAVVGALELGIDEAVDGLMADDPMALLMGQAPRNLFGRPSASQSVQHLFPQAIVTLEPRSGPAPGIGLRLRIGGLITDFGTGVALQLARDGRRLAIQSCSDLPDRLPVFMKTGNRTAFLDR